MRAASLGCRALSKRGSLKREVVALRDLPMMGFEEVAPRPRLPKRSTRSDAKSTQLYPHCGHRVAQAAQGSQKERRLVSFPYAVSRDGWEEDRSF